MRLRSTEQKCKICVCMCVCVWFRHVKGVRRAGDSPTQNQSRPKEYSDHCPPVSR